MSSTKQGNLFDYKNGKLSLNGKAEDVAPIAKRHITFQFIAKVILILAVLLANVLILLFG